MRSQQIRVDPEFNRQLTLMKRRLEKDMRRDLNMTEVTRYLAVRKK